MAFAKPTPADLQHRYKHHPPTGDQTRRYEQVRAAILVAAETLVILTPCSPEQTRALNALDEAMMLANAAIAREMTSTAIARQFYKHVACGTEKPTSVVAVERNGLPDPKSRDQGYCVTCQKWFPLGEFVWRGESESRDEAEKPT